MADNTESRSVLKQPSDKAQASGLPANKQVAKQKGEVGGPKGPEPTRYGDWEKGGRCFDF